MRILRNALILVIVLVALGSTAGVAAIRGRFSADRPPGRLETAVARRLVVLAIPSAERSMTNPEAANADAWRGAEDHFQDHCAMCHGGDGHGNPEIARKMYPPVPDLADPAIQRMSDGALFSIIENGVRWTGMPAFKSEHTADETWKLVSFVRQVPKLKEAPATATAGHAGDNGGSSTIAMDGTSFAPAEMTVKVGDTVTWINKDPFPHNISSKAGGLHSGDLEPDASWQFHATTPGSFHYVCTLHPGMKGTLVVTP